MINMKEITVKEVQQRLEKGEELNLIDVREVSEVQEEHIAGIVNIPLDLLEFQLQDLDKNKQYIIVCRSSARSGRATEFLTAKGYNVTNMVGGMMSWEGEVQ